MKSSTLVGLGVLLASPFLLGGCQSAVTTKVSLYHPKTRLWELEAKARDAKQAKAKSEQAGHQQEAPGVEMTAKTPQGEAARRPDPEVLRYLAPEEQRAYAQLWLYAQENPQPELKDPYPAAGLNKLRDQIQAHAVVVAQLQAFVDKLAEPERKKLIEVLQNEINRYQNIVAEKKVAEASRPANKQAIDQSFARVLEDSWTRMKAFETKLKEYQTKTDTLGAQIAKALNQTIEGAQTSLAKARTEYAAAKAALPVVRVQELDTVAAKRRNIEDAYVGQVENTTRVFLTEFWIIAEFPAALTKAPESAQSPAKRGAETFAKWLDQEIQLPSELVQVYGSDQQSRIPLGQLIPTTQGGRGSAQRLTQLTAQLVPAPVTLPSPGDGYHTEQVANPLISIAASDAAGWQATPSYVQRKTTSRNEFLIVRESLTRYHAVAMRDTPSTTVDASMRFAVATGAVIMEVAQTVAGLNLGISLPAGGVDDATDTSEINELKAQVSPWTAEKLSQMARIRAERVRQLLARQPKGGERTSTEWQTWIAEAKGLLNSHREIAAAKSPQPAAEAPATLPDSAAPSAAAAPAAAAAAAPAAAAPGSP